MAGHECYHCKNWVEEGEAHDCWTTTETALTRELSEDLQDAWERLRATAADFGDQRIYASHHAIMFSRRACYFFVRPKRNMLEVVFFLGRPVKAPQIRSARRTSHTKIAHTVHVKHRDEVEAPITDWLQEAYETSDTLSERRAESAELRTRNAERGSTRAKRAAKKKPAAKIRKKTSSRRKPAAVAIVLAIVGSIATVAAQTPAVPLDTRITLERTTCYGTCPAYSVTIDAGGNVTYEGQQHVRVSGRQHTRIAIKQVRALLDTAERIGFSEFADHYPTNVDSPVTRVTVTARGRTKRVSGELGKPAPLRAFEKEIDAASGSSRWVRIDVATLRQLAAYHALPGVREQMSWLRKALAYDEVPVVIELLALGLDPNARGMSIPLVPLNWAKSAAAARALIDAGADPRKGDGSWTPLVAAGHKRPEVAQVLLDAGARPDDTDINRNRPLYAAACAGNAGVVEILLKAGANPAAPGKSGESPLQCARRKKRNAEAARDGDFERDFERDFDRVIGLLEPRIKSGVQR